MGLCGVQAPSRWWALEGEASLAWWGLPFPMGWWDKAQEAGLGCTALHCMHHTLYYLCTVDPIEFVEGRTKQEELSASLTLFYPLQQLITYRYGLLKV